MGTGEFAHIELRQLVSEVVPTLINSDTGERLPLEYMRCLFYIDYALDDVPRNMVTDEELLRISSLYKDYLSTGEETIREAEELLAKKGLPVSLPLDPNLAVVKILKVIFTPDRDAAPSGFTIRLMFAIASHLLIQLVEKRNSKAIPFENIIVYNKQGKRFFPLVLSIDEPELHLHPYLQRAVLAFLQSILNNEEPFFRKLIQKTLGVDGLDGQLFVVTHSTDSLVNDYRQIIRLYWNKEKKVQVSCGITFHFSREIEKQIGRAHV